MAALVGLLTGDKNLGSQVDIGPGGLTGTLDSIGKRGCGGVGPAGTAVLGDVLVADVGDHADTVDVVPDPLGGKVVDGHERGVDASLGSVNVTNMAGGVEVDSAEGRYGGDAHESDGSERFHLKELLFFIIIKYSARYPLYIYY